MRRSACNTAVFDSSKAAFRHRLTVATLAAFVIATMFAFGANAQISGTGCGDDLIRPNEAGTGTLLLKTAIPGCYVEAPRVATGIDVDISGPIARTRVTQRFRNPADGWVEGLYVFPLPDGSAVDTLKMVVGERLIEGEIRERQEARRIYETARSEGRTASLGEQIRPNIFNNNVANIGPLETIVIQIEYQESLRFDAGRYHLRVPLAVAPRYAPQPILQLTRLEGGGLQFGVADPVPDRERINGPVIPPEYGKINPVSLTIQLEAGFDLGAVESGSHEIQVVRNGTTAATIALQEGEVPADRDFALEFAPVEETIPTVSLLRENWGGEDYLLAFVVPPTIAPGATLPREAIFILDNSGSMGGESIRQAKASLLLALDRLNPNDRFNIVRFNDSMDELFPAPVDASRENVAFAKGYVSSIQAGGGTEMLPALISALTDVTPDDRTRLRQVIFLTDGAVGNEAQLFAAINQRLGRSRLFTVGIGSAPNSYFMAGASRAGRGSFTYIGNVDEVVPRMSELFEKLEHPVMINLAAEWPEGVAGETWPNPIPDLYSGEPILITMKTSEADGLITLSGTLGGVPWRQTLDLSDARVTSGIEKLWARNKIAALDESRVYGANPGAIDRAVLDIALSHHLTSRLTSLVAVDITPRRPDSAPLTSREIPLNLPEGWDFDKVFGERQSNDVQHTQDGTPNVVLTQIAMSDAPPAVLGPGDAALNLPQGGTLSRLLMLLGFVFLLFGTLVLGGGRLRGARLA